jgi:galactokinase
LISQRAEHEFVGVNCGLMDQFASVFGRKDQIIKMDCKDNSYSYLPFGFPDKQFLLFDSRVKHSLAASEYNLRRSQCEQGLHLIQKHDPSITSFREVSLDILMKYVAGQDEETFKRCLYVVAEIERVIEACELLLQNKPVEFGQKMFECHDGLKNLYEVSCPELDFLVESAKSEDGVLGSRMMGGGFGGCTINLVDSDCVNAVIEKVSRSYKQKFGIEVRPILVSLASGTALVDRDMEMCQ